MIQQNQQTQHHCDNKVLSAILSCSAFYKLPHLYNENWESMPIDSIELNERINLLGEAQNAKQSDIEREPHHFMTTLLTTQVFEGSLSHYKDIKNEDIVKNCKGGLTKEITVRLAEVKVALICQYLRFMENAINAYNEIAQEYKKLPKKTHITQEIVDEELATKLAIEQMNQSLSGQASLDVDILIPKTTEMPYPILDVAKKIGITFKELKANYPVYRSRFNADTQFTYCMWTYSYYFFINNFTYEKKEEGATFAYSTMEYIKHLIPGTIYNPPNESTYRSILDGIAELKQAAKQASEQASVSHYQFRYQDAIQCDFKMNDDGNTIGLYFPMSNDSYLEKTDKTS
jgi:hypothetical protein